MTAEREELASRIPDLLFNIASGDRLKLLSEIASKRQRMTALSKTIDASAAEGSRHLKRLSDAGLVRKDSEGFYEATTVGRTVLKLLPGIGLLLEHQDYFRSRDLSFLPLEFVERIGELSKADRVNQLSAVLEHIKSVVSQGKDHVWLISDNLFPQWPGIGSSFLSTDLPVRLIAEESTSRKVVSEYKSRLPRTEIAVLKEVRIGMVVSETTAGVCFPTETGGIDFTSGFAGSDPSFLAWCNDLFEYYWADARKIYTPF
jgi:predicted transcriptional regulator